MREKTVIAILFASLLLSASCAEIRKKETKNKSSTKDCLQLKVENESYSYVDNQGKTVIAADKYLSFFTEKFCTYAIVLDKEQGVVGIDRNENILYHVFVFDNGPDDASEGLFRIIKDGKIGFASEKTGEIMIEPKYEAAYPFENGKAKVALKASKKSDGEHYTWESDEWIFISND